MSSLFRMFALAALAQGAPIVIQMQSIMDDLKVKSFIMP